MTREERIRMLKRRLQEQKSSGKVAMVKRAMEMLMERVELTGDDARMAQIIMEILDTRTFNYESWDADTAEIRSGLKQAAEFVGGLILAAAEKNRAEGTEAAFWAIKGIAEFASRFDRSLYNQILDVQIGG